jgi:cytochrome o ubiquinol oxidase subunit IV
MDTQLSLNEIQKEYHGSLKSYLIGFILSLALTSASFFLVSTMLLSGQTLIFAIVGLALMQAISQLLFFLHLGREARPRWETFVFYFMLLILVIIVAGSLWIIYDLNDRVMSNMSNLKKEYPHD